MAEFIRTDISLDNILLLHSLTMDGKAVWELGPWSPVGFLGVKSKAMVKVRTVLVFVRKFDYV